MELTREHFDKTVKLLATQESLDELVEKVTEVEKTLSEHTTTLDSLATDVKKLSEDKIVDTYQFDQAKEHIEQLAKHTNLKLEY